MEYEFPKDCKYTREHEWIRLDGSIAYVGITEYAQSSLGDIVYVELPEVGRSLERDEVFGVVESVKAVSDLYSPVAGEVCEVNDSLPDSPELVNEDPHGEAWMLKLNIADENDLSDLLSAAEYESFVKEVED